MNSHTLIENWEKGIGGVPVLCGPNMHGLPIKRTSDGTRCHFMQVTFDALGEVASVRGEMLSFEECRQMATYFSTEDSINEKLVDVAVFLRLAKGVEDIDWENGFELNL